MIARSRPQLRWCIVALALASFPALNGRADTLASDAPMVRLTFTGTVSASNEHFLAPAITPQVGDPFQLSLVFWRTDAPYEKTVGGWFPDTTPRGAVSEQLWVNGVSYFGGQDFTSFDTHSSLSLSNGTLGFVATDQGFGAWGTALVGSDFPTTWFQDIRDPLPNGQTLVDFGALGQFDYYYGLPGYPSLSGLISGGSVELWGGIQSAGNLPVPEAASLGMLLPLGVLLLRRRRACV
jgi:hypothetical protein